MGSSNQLWKLEALDLTYKNSPRSSGQESDGVVRHSQGDGLICRSHLPLTTVVTVPVLRSGAGHHHLERSEVQGEGKLWLITRHRSWEPG